MKVVHSSNAASFRDVVQPCLLADEARHNLMLGLIGTLVDQPDVYPRHDLWWVQDAGRIVGAALRTHPHMLVLARPREEGVLEALARRLAEEDDPLPGVVGALPEAGLFARLYEDAAGVEVASRMEQAIHALEHVEAVPLTPGTWRHAGRDDLDLLLLWHRAFSEEAGGEGAGDDEQKRRRLLHRVAEERGEGFRLWEDGEPVCLVGFVAATESAMRVGPVYTPPEHRRRGYATALVAQVSRELLARGLRRCLLYTDLANPTSNAIYHRIGYRVVCHSAMIRFRTPGASVA